MLCVVAGEGDGEMHLWGMQEAMMKWYDVFPNMKYRREEKETKESIQQQQKDFNYILVILEVQRKWWWSINEVWFWHILEVVTIVTT